MNRVCFRATVTFRLKLRLSQTKTWLARDTLGGEGLVMGVATQSVDVASPSRLAQALESFHVPVRQYAQVRRAGPRVRRAR